MFYSFIFMLFCGGHAMDMIDDKTTKTIDNEIKSPFTLTKLDNESVKKSLDDVVMLRRITHFTVPDIYDIPNLKINRKSKETSNIPFKEADNKESQIKKIKHTKYDTGIKDIPYLKNERNRVPDHSSDFEKYNIQKTFRSMETSEISQNEKLYKVLTKQAELIGKLAQIIEFDEYLRQSKNDFEELLKDIDEKRNATVLESDRNKTTVSEREITTERLPTVMAVVDETAVREALKADPYVKRILKMAAKRKESYVRAAKQYFKL